MQTCLREYSPASLLGACIFHRAWNKLIPINKTAWLAKNISIIRKPIYTGRFYKFRQELCHENTPNINTKRLHHAWFSAQLKLKPNTILSSRSVALFFCSIFLSLGPILDVSPQLANSCQYYYARNLSVAKVSSARPVPDRKTPFRSSYSLYVFSIYGACPFNQNWGEIWPVIKECEGCSPKHSSFMNSWGLTLCQKATLVTCFIYTHGLTVPQLSSTKSLKLYIMRFIYDAHFNPWRFENAEMFVTSDAVFLIWLNP